MNTISNEPHSVIDSHIEGTHIFDPSLIQSFLVIFLSEIADRTFILVLIYSLKMNKIPLIFTSLFAMYFMNILAIVAGYTLFLLAPRSLIDWIGFICFLGFSLFCVYEGLQMESKSVQEEYEEEIQRTDSNYNSLVNEEDRNNNKDSTLKLCLELFGFLCLSELGDKSELTTVTIEAIYNLYAILIGTMLVYFSNIAIAALLGHYIGKFLEEKMMNIIGGLLFIGFAIQILIIKLFF